MKLCFGVFATILKCCSRRITQEKLVAKLAKCVDESSNYVASEFRYKDIDKEDIEGDKPAISKLINCKKNFFFSDGNDIKKPELNEVVENLNVCLIPLISDEEKIKFILALVRVIQLDESINLDEREIFKKTFGVEKKQFLEQTEYVFSDILGKALLYTVNSEVENIEGADCIKTITPKFINEEFDFYCYDYEWDSDKKSLKLLQYKIFNLFNALLLKYNINEFVESVDPTRHVVLPKWILKIENFNLEAETQIWNQYNKSSPFLNEIRNFSIELDDYLYYLTLNMRPVYASHEISLPLDFSQESDDDLELILNKCSEYADHEISVPIYMDEDTQARINFENTVENFRSKLKYIYQKILKLTKREPLKTPAKSKNGQDTPDTMKAGEGELAPIETG